MDERIELADGTIVENAYIVKMDDSFIAAYVNGKHTFMEIAGWFGDAEKTKTMKTFQYGDKHTWKGFTTITSVNIRENDTCVCLIK